MSDGDHEFAPGREPGLRWFAGGRQGLGSAALAQRLRGSLELMASQCGVTVPQVCRAGNALAFFDRLNARDAVPAPVGDPTFERRLVSHDRTARELFLITYAAGLDARNPATPFTADKLGACLFGADVEEDEGRDAEGRNTQFEMVVAATLRLGGIGVFRGEPDLIAEVAGERVGIAAKRVRSLRADVFEDRVESAVEQIGRSGLPGYVALNVVRQFDGIDPRSAQEDLFQELSGMFDSLRYRQAIGRAGVVGAMLFGYGAVLTARPGGEIPMLTVVTPARWERWPEEGEQAARFQAFVEAWYTRVERNMGFIMSPEVGSRPL